MSRYFEIIWITHYMHTSNNKKFLWKHVFKETFPFVAKFHKFARTQVKYHDAFRWRIDVLLTYGKTQYSISISPRFLIFPGGIEIKHCLNPYSPNFTFLYPLKTSENLRFSDVFREHRNVTLGKYGLN